VKAERVKKWHPEFILGSPEFKRMESLLGGGKEAIEQYGLTEVSQIKDIFIASYIGLTEEKNTSKEVAALGHSQLYRRSSMVINSIQSVPGLKHNPQRSAPTETGGLEELSKQFTSILSKKGRGLVSVYQLRTHMERYLDSARLAVEHASDLISPRVPETNSTNEMTLLEFLWRVGMEKHYWNIRNHCPSDNVLDMLEGNGNNWSAGIYNEAEKEFLEALLSGNDQGPERIRNMFFKPAFSLVVERSTKCLRFSDSEARNFSREITSRISSFSTYRFEQYIRAGAVEQVTCLLPPKTITREDISSTWVYQWLKTFDLERLAYRFTSLGIRTKRHFTKPEMYSPEYAGMSIVWERELQAAIKDLEDKIEKESEKEKQPKVEPKVAEENQAEV